MSRLGSNEKTTAPRGSGQLRAERRQNSNATARITKR
ncbi:hypothetical protein IAE36_001095 [Pseudomonas sp. S36]|nr:hypothetical protein [Pseudomonas sp. S36]